MKKIMIIAALMLTSTMMYGQLKVVKGVDVAGCDYERYELRIDNLVFKGPSVEDAEKGDARFEFDTNEYISFLYKEKVITNMTEFWLNREKYFQPILDYIRENEEEIEKRFNIDIRNINQGKKEIYMMDKSFYFWCYPQNMDDTAPSNK